MQTIKLLLLPLLSIVIWGCSTPTETITRRVQLKAVSPAIHDTILVTVERDTVIEGEKIVKIDTLILVKYFPVEKKFYVYAKPDTVTIIHTDTTQVIKPQIIETPFLSKLGIAAIGAIVVIIALVVIKLKGRL